MKTSLLNTLLLLLTVSAFAQSEQAGITRPMGGSSSPLSTKRALVVGISDYQSAEVPDLQFADRDAEAFAEWLKSPAGGNVPPENIQLFLNEQATQSRLVNALDWLVESSNPGDEAVIYFSGHGDVETKSFTQMGFLLMWNCAGQNYMAGGTFPVYFLQDIVSNLSVTKNCRVILVTDACHAGKLAGSDIGGTQLTGQSLQKQYANELKIMSCQPNQFSLEGTQWGGGRGLFSYHLLDGLTGLADRNEDALVSLSEIDRYLEDRVAAEAAPQVQTPMTSGDKQANIARVDAPALAALRTRKASQVAGIAGTDSKGIADAILGAADSLLRALYQGFETALQKGDLLEPEGQCANDLYLRLVQEESLQPLHNIMRRNLAAALQDEVQQALNALLDNDPYEANSWTYHPGKYAQNPAYLQRSMELLGEDHYMYRSLKAKKLYFEGYNLAKNISNLEDRPAVRDSLRQAAKARFLESIRLEPAAAYPCHAIGNLYYNTVPYQTDSLLHWCGKALALAPNWVAPYLEIAYEYGSAQYDLPQAETWMRKALALQPDNYLVLERLSWLKQWEGKADESIAISKQMIALKPELFNAYSTIAQTLAYMKGEYLEAEKYCLQSLALEPGREWATNVLNTAQIKTRRAELVVDRCEKWLNQPGGVSANDRVSMLVSLVAALTQLGRYEEAERYGRLADALQTGALFQQSQLKAEAGRLYFILGDLDRAEKTLQLALEIDPTANLAWNGILALLGEIKSRQGKPEEAEAIFQRAITVLAAPGKAFRDEAFFRYGKFLLNQGRPAEAEAQFRAIGNLLPKSYYHGYGMALLAASQGRHAEAIDWLERALDNFWPDATSIQTEPLFEKLRKTKRYKALMAKHFGL